VVDFEQLKQILGLVREHDLAEFEIEQDGVRLKIRKAAGTHAAVPPAPPAAPAAAVDPVPGPALQPAGGSRAHPASGEGEVELAVIKSPIVGTFYRSAEPGAPAFVDIGSPVKKGQVLCIIEAMKLMNEIESEYDGEITAIYVENGHTVQYGERLFAIRAR
jgi:acetyl-CoA carboxylase biotin carboxyl carrier protein